MRLCVGETAVIVRHVGRGVVTRNSETPTVGAGQGSDGLLVIDVTSLTATVRLIYAGTVEEVDLGILCPSVLAVARTEDIGMGCAVGAVDVADGGVDVDVGLEGATVAVVAAIDGTAAGSAALVVYVGLIDIAGPEVA